MQSLGFRGVNGWGQFFLAVIRALRRSGYLEILSMTRAWEALRTYSLPVTVTCSPANGINLGFCGEEGVLLSMGRKMVPSSRRMTSVEPFFAHALAQATPMGLPRPLV